MKTGDLSNCNGGHNLPYIQSKDGAVKELENVGGLLLSKFEGAPYEMTTVQLNPGDTVGTFTDGVTEAEDEGVDFFDVELVYQLSRESSTQNVGIPCERNITGSDEIHGSRRTVR